MGRSSFLLLVATFLCSQYVNAALVARYAGASFGGAMDAGSAAEVEAMTQRKKHVIVVGVGNDLGAMFLKAAMGKVAKIMDAEPTAEILVYAQVTKDLQKETQILWEMGLDVLEASEQPMPLSSILKSARQGRKISSLSFYVHSAITYGIHLYKGGRYNQDDSNWDYLKGAFTEDAYMYLIGCNTGFYLAPALSSKLQIPVAGALTSTDFQYLNDRNEWKYAAPTGDLTYPQVNDNTKSFARPVSCQTGACSRLQPYFRSYSGYWGDFKNGGFPGFKFFCQGLDQAKCERVMAKSLQHQISNVPLNSSSSELENRKALANIMCPQVREQNQLEQCKRFVLDFDAEATVSSYSPFWEKTLYCDLNSCQFAFKCEARSWFNSDVRCVLENPFATSDSFVEEIRHYIRGFKLKQAIQ